MKKLNMTEKDHTITVRKNVFWSYGLKSMWVYALIMSILLCLIWQPEISAQAAGNRNQKACKAYGAYLKSKATDWQSSYFSLVDIDKDGVKELVTGDDKEPYHAAIMAYVNGRVKNVGSGFSGDEIFYPNKRIYYSTTWHTGSADEYYYQFNGKKMITLAEKHGCDYMNIITGKQKTEEEIQNAKDIFAPYLYKIRGKRVSKKKYKAYVKKIMKGAKEKKLKYVKNTAANRKKYLNV